MISERTQPKSKHDLVKALDKAGRIDFEVVDVETAADKSTVTQMINRWISKKPFTVIFVRKT